MENTEELKNHESRCLCKEDCDFDYYVKDVSCCYTKYEIRKSCLGCNFEEKVYFSESDVEEEFYKLKKEQEKGEK